jgi:cell division protein FtsW (lipid II flippase)
MQLGGRVVRYLIKIVWSDKNDHGDALVLAMTFLHSSYMKGLNLRCLCCLSVIFFTCRGPTLAMPGACKMPLIGVLLGLPKGLSADG